MIESPSQQPVVIVGRGLVGLCLAQALKKADIPCTVYERDDALETDKGGGWAITIHWALQALQECLPANLFRQLADIQVDREQGIKDTGRFLFLDLATAQPKYEIPPSKRMRVNRRLLRLLLAEGIDIRYGKHLVSFNAAEGDHAATVTFGDGTSADSKLVIGCDGSNSKMRHLLFGEDSTKSRLYHLPVRALGVTIRMTEQQIVPLRQIDPLLFQGSHPETGTFLWYSTISTPSLNRSDGADEPYYEGQLIMSWLYRLPDDDVPADHEERRMLMRRMAAPFHDTLRTAVELVPKGTAVKEVRLADWPTQAWPNHEGKVGLCGDAAHAMTMFRGEAFNHGVTDAAKLARLLVWVRDEEMTMRDAIDEYEEELVSRTYEAVLLSRQACLDAHSLQDLGPDSPLVSKRARILAPATTVSGKEGASMPKG